MKNKKENPKGLKLLSATIFAFLLIILLEFNRIFVFIHTIKGNIYASQTKPSLIFGYGIIIISIILNFIVYNKLFIKKRDYKDYFSLNKKKLIAVSLLLILGLTVCNLSFNYIDRENEQYSTLSLIKKEVIYGENDIKSISIASLNIADSPNGKRIRNEYIIICKIDADKGSYTLESSSFKSYKEMYEYLKDIDCSKSIDKQNLSKLLNFEKSKADKEEINYINKIFELK